MSVSLSDVGANTEPSAETRVRPTCSRTLRSSGWTRTIRAMAPKLEDVCRQIDSHQCQQTLDKLDRPGFPEQLDELEHHIRNNADINEIGDAEQGNLPNQHICKF